MRTTQSIKVEDKMLPAVNEMLTGQINKSAKPFNVEGFPSIIAVDKKGNVVTNIEPIRNTATMTKVMAEAGPIAEEAGINKSEVNMIEVNSAVKNNLKNVIKAPNASIKPNGPALANLGLEETGLVGGPKNIDVGEEELKGSIASLNSPKSVKNLNSIPANNMKNAGINKVKDIKLNIVEATAPSGVNSFPNKNIKSNAPPASMKEVEKEAEAITSMAAPLAPSNSSIDMESEPISNQLTPEQKLSGGGGSKGGSLYSAMARTTFTLAPAAALLATAAMVMKKSNRKFRNTRKHLTKSRKSRKSYRRH
jgi:hypothetical protein